MPRGVKSEVGDTNVSANGYHYTKTETGWELTHHLIAMKALGRPLRSDETARFRDGDKTNLDPDNIVVMTKKQSLRGRLAVVESKLAELNAERDDLLRKLARQNGSTVHS